MKEYIFDELGYFTVSVCEQLKKLMDGKTFMNFKVGYSNQAGNCTLIVETDYDDTEENIKGHFLSYALWVLADLTY